VLTSDVDFCNELAAVRVIMKLFRGAEFEDTSEEL